MPTQDELAEIWAGGNTIGGGSPPPPPPPSWWEVYAPDDPPPPSWWEQYQTPGVGNTEYNIDGQQYSYNNVPYSADIAQPSVEHIPNSPPKLTVGGQSIVDIIGNFVSTTQAAAKAASDANEKVQNKIFDTSQDDPPDIFNEITSLLFGRELSVLKGTSGPDPLLTSIFGNRNPDLLDVTDQGDVEAKTINAIIEDARPQNQIPGVNALRAILTAEAQGLPIGQLGMLKPITDINKRVGEYTKIVGEGREVAYDKDFFHNLYAGVDIPSGDIPRDQVIESYRQELVGAQDELLTKRLVNQWILTDLEMQRGILYTDAYQQQHPTLKRDVDQHVYISELIKDTPQFQNVTIEHIAQLIELDLTNKYPDTFYQIAASGITSNQTGVGSATNYVKALADEAGVTTDAAEAYALYRTNRGSFGDIYPQYKEEMDRNAWERITKSTYDFLSGGMSAGFNRVEGTVINPIDVRFAKAAQSPLMQSVSKFLDPDNEHELWSRLDEIPEPARHLVEERFWAILNMEDPGALFDSLKDGPQLVDLYGKPVTLTEEQYDEWVDSAISQNLVWQNGVFEFAGQAIFDPTNVLLFAKPAVVLAKIPALVDVAQMVRMLDQAFEAKNFGLIEKFQLAAKTRNWLIVPGAPTVAMTLSTKLRNVAKASTHIDEGARLIENELALAPTIASKTGPGVINKIFSNIKNPIRTRLFYQTRLNNVERLSRDAANGTDWMIRVARGHESGTAVKLNALVDELAIAVKADPKDLTAVNQVFKKYGITGNKQRWLATNFAKDTDAVNSVRGTMVTAARDGWDAGRVEGAFLDVVTRRSRRTFMKDMFSAGELSDIGKIVSGADIALASGQRIMRVLLGKAYLATVRFHIRNITTDTLRGVEGSYGWWRSTENNLAYLRTKFPQGIVTTPHGPEETVDLLGDAAVQLAKAGRFDDLVEESIIASEGKGLMKPIKFMWRSILGDVKLGNKVEGSGRLNIFTQALEKGDIAMKDELGELITDITKAATLSNPQFAKEFDEVALAMERLLDHGANEKEWTALRNSLRTGSIQTMADWGKITGVSLPRNLSVYWRQQLQTSLRKMEAYKRSGYIANQRVLAQKQLHINAGKYTSNVKNVNKFLDGTTDAFIKEMDFWKLQGINTEEAMARALPIYTNRLRKGIGHRAVVERIRQVKPALADELDTYIALREAEMFRFESEFIAGITKYGDEFKRAADGGVPQINRLKIWDTGYDGVRKYIVNKAQLAGIDDLGFTGTEFRANMGMAGKQGFDEMITGVDGAAAEAGPAQWYMSRMERGLAPKGVKITNSAKIPKDRTWQGQASEMVDKVRNEQIDLQGVYSEYAILETNRIMFDYSNTGDIDFLLKFIFPWQFWPTRAMPRYMEIAAKKPYLLSHYARMEEVLDDIDDERLIRLRGKIPIPFMGFAGPWSRAGIDPFAALIPTDFMDSVVFDDEFESKFGAIKAIAGLGGMGVNPILDGVNSAIEFYTGGDPYESTINFPHVETFINMSIQILNQMVNTNDKEVLRYTPAIVNRIGIELVAVRAENPDQFTDEDMDAAILELKQKFPVTGNIIEQLTRGKHDNITDLFSIQGLKTIVRSDEPIQSRLLSIAHSRGLDRATVERGISIFSGMQFAFGPPGYLDTLSAKDEFREVLSRAYALDDAGQPEALEKLRKDPRTALAFYPLPNSITEYEAERAVARNEYWPLNNEFDEQLLRLQAQYSPFDPELKAQEMKIYAEKAKLMPAILKKHPTLSEEEIIGSSFLAVDIGRVIQRLLHGEITPVEAANAFNIHTARAFAPLLTPKADDFFDQDGVFMGGLFFEVSNWLLDTLPTKIKDAAQAWKKRDATPYEAIEDAYNTLYTDIVWGGIARIGKEVDKEARAVAIENWKSTAQFPTDEVFLDFVRQNYPMIDMTEVAKILSGTFLPNFRLRNVYKQQEEIDILREVDQPFRSQNGTLINKKNVDEFEAAYEEFRVYSFAREKGLSTKDLWTPMIEKYWGKSANVTRITELLEIDSEINRIIVNSGATTEEELTALLNDNNELGRLYERKAAIEADVIDEDKRDNFKNGRTFVTSLTRASQQFGGQEVSAPLTFTAGGVGIVLTHGKPEWFTEIRRAINSGSKIKSTAASELYAIFKRFPLGFNTFDKWLVALVEKWEALGRPGPQYVAELLGEKARELSPGETTSIQE